jgi:hypothetical protein
MRPAFASIRQAAAFALLLLVLLLLPALLGKSNLPPREQIYSSIWWANGAFPYIDNQFFKEKGDIDIAFIGPSHIWNAINTPHVQKQLSERLGRPAVVRSFCWGGAGYDMLYSVAQDLLQHRKVHMLVFYDAYTDMNLPNGLAPHLFRWGDNADELTGLSLPLKLSYYFAAVIGMPRNLLSLTRSNIPADLFSSKMNFWEIQDHADNFVRSLGSLASQSGFRHHPLSDPEVPFERYIPTSTASPADVCVYSSSNKGPFEFTGSMVPLWQLHFARKFAETANEHGSKLVLLHIPGTDEMRSDVIQEREFWPDALQAEVTMVGIPPAKLFGGLSDAEVYKLFGDPGHLNKNGQEYFTEMITPSLLQIYDSKTNP